MTKYNAKNERIKKEFYDYLVESQGRNSGTLDQIRSSIYRFEEYTKFKNFSSFNKEQAKGFKKNLVKQKTKKDGGAMSKSTLLHISINLKQFFNWLRDQKGYQKIKVTDIEYFNLLGNEIAAARGKKIKYIPTIEQIRKVIFSLPNGTEIEKLHRAIIAFTILTGIRDLAISSLKIRHIDIHRRLVIQDPNDGVKTKKGKLIYTKFFPVGDDIEQVVVEWVKFLREDKLYGETDPAFPRTKLGHGKDFAFEAQGLEPIFWTSASQIRKIFKTSFQKCGLPYFNPHSFRDTINDLGKNSCNIAQYKAWSQNLGHEKMPTSLDNYGQLDVHRQLELIDSIKALNQSNCFNF